MNVDSRLDRVEKALEGNQTLVDVFGVLVPISGLESEDDRIKAIVQIARGLLPKAPLKHLEEARRYDDVYPYPQYLISLCERARVCESEGLECNH